MPELRRLDSTTCVAAGPIAPDDVAALPVSLIVNNRPDGEEEGQPRSADIEAAARAAGIAYRHIPVGGFSEAQIEAMQAALTEADGPVLAFCRSGTRSTYLWALARARMGEAAAELVAQAAAAGYDLRPIRRWLITRT
jgi:uncharacterized protein (TIGR01244 family)